MTTIREAFMRMQAGQIDADTFLAIVEQEMMKACEVTEEMVSDIKEIAGMFTTALQKRAGGEE